MMALRPIKHKHPSYAHYDKHFYHMPANYGMPNAPNHQGFFIKLAPATRLYAWAPAL